MFFSFFFFFFLVLDGEAHGASAYVIESSTLIKVGCMKKKKKVLMPAVLLANEHVELPR